MKNCHINRLIFLCWIISFVPNLMTAQQTLNQGNSKIIAIDQQQDMLRASSENVLKKLNLDSSFDLELKDKYSRDRVHRYRLKYDNVEVKNIHLITHNKDNYLSKIVTSNTIEKINIEKKPIVFSADDAVEIFSQKVADKKPLIAPGTMEPQIKQVYYPAHKNSNEYVLCYEIYLMLEEKPFQIVGYINAETGSVLKIMDAATDCNSPGTAHTGFSNVQPITTNLDSGTNDFTLLDCTRGGGIHTQNVQNSSQINNAIDYHDDDNIWDDYPAPNQFDRFALDGHWGVAMSYDYYMNNHNIDITNGELYHCYLSSSFLNRNNASNIGPLNSVVFGQAFTETGQGLGYMTTLDVVGHEMAHQMTYNSAQLIYENESGSLNEAYSDIFGMIIQDFGGVYNWTQNEQLNTFRNMANPNDFDDPDTYQGLHYYTGDNQSVLVHTNSGVINHWFYLLVEGGQGINDNGENFAVSGIPLTTAADLIMEVLLAYLQPASNFADFRTATVAAAIDLYGICSVELEAAINAFHAVGLGPKYTATAPITNLSADAITNCSAKLSWDDNGSPFYSISYREAGTSNWTTINDIITEEFVISDLSPGTTYESFVTNLCVDPNTTPQIISFTTGQICPAVQSFTQSDMTSCSIRITWDDLGATHYEFYYRAFGTTNYTQEISPTNSILLSGLNNGGGYEFYVRTICSSQCNSTDSTIDKFALDFCVANNTVSLISATMCFIRFGWIPNPGETYTVTWRDQYQGSNGPWNVAIPDHPDDDFVRFLHLNPAAIGIEFFLTTTCPGEQCEIVVDSPIQQEPLLPFDPNATCQAPQNLQLELINPGGANTWTASWDPVPGADSYEVKYRVDPNNNWVTQGGVLDLSFSRSNVLNIVCLEVEVRAQCGCTASTIQFGDPTAASICPPCDPPGNLYIDDICPTEARAYFTPHPGMHTFVIRWYPTGSTIFDQTGDPAFVGSILLEDLLPNTEYQVEAWSTCGNQTQSTVESLQFTTADICQPPTGLVGVANDATSATLTWDPSPVNLNYIIQYRQASSPDWIEGTVTSTSVDITNADLNEGIFFRVINVCNPCDQSTPSAEVFVQNAAGLCVPGIYMSPDPNETGCHPCQKDCYVCLYDGNGVKLNENGNWYEIEWTQFPAGYPYTTTELWNGQCLPMGPQFEGETFEATIYQFDILVNPNDVKTVICTQEFSYTHTCTGTSTSGGEGGERDIPQNENLTASEMLPTFFPNPTSSSITIENPAMELIEVNLFDLHGKLILSQNIAGLSEKQIELDALSAGIYYLQMNNEQQETIVTERLIKLN